MPCILDRKTLPDSLVGIDPEARGAYDDVLVCRACCAVVTVFYSATPKIMPFFHVSQIKRIPCGVPAKVTSRITGDQATALHGAGEVCVVS